MNKHDQERAERKKAEYQACVLGWRIDFSRQSGHWEVYDGTDRRHTVCPNLNEAKKELMRCRKTFCGHLAVK